MTCHALQISTIPQFRNLLEPVPDGNEGSILKSWMQNRLREHFRRQNQIVNFSKPFDEPCISEPHLVGELDELSFEGENLRVLDIRHVPQSRAETEDDTEDVVAKGLSLARAEGYQNATKRLAVLIQRSESVQTLSLCLNIGEVVDAKMLEEIVHPFVPYAEKHEIQIYTELIPIIEGHVKGYDADISLSIPTCYFGKIEEETLTKDHDQVDATAVEIVESHRILILEDVRAEGFSRKNATGCSLLPLLNVRAVFVELGKFHGTAWALEVTSGFKHLDRWPFLENSNYFSYLLKKLSTGFPLILTTVSKYLTKTNANDSKLIMDNLGQAVGSLPALVEQLKPSSSSLQDSSLTTVIHQSLNFDSALFRHSYLKVQGEVAKQSVRELRLLDWKTASVGSPLQDVASFLLMSLPPKVRRSESPSLLKGYWEEFKKTAGALGVSEPELNFPPGTVSDVGFAKGLLHGCLLMASNVTPVSQISEQDLEIFVEGFRDLITLKII